MRRKILTKLITSFLAAGGLFIYNCAEAANIYGIEGADGRYSVIINSEVIEEGNSGNDKSLSGFNDSIYGVYNRNGDAANGYAQITDSSLGERTMIYGGYSFNGNVYDNEVYIDGGSVSRDGSIYGGSTVDGSAYNNTVRINNAAIGESSFIYGGRGKDAYNNKVYIDGGTLAGEFVRGGYATSFGKYADNNTVEIKNAEISCKIYGGYTDSNYAEVNSNAVILENVQILGDRNIYGGYSKGGETDYNTVTLKGNSSVENASIYGGSSFGAGNKLIVNDWAGDVNAVKNFGSIEFQHIAWDNGGTVMNITGGDAGDLNSTDISVSSTDGIYFSGQTPKAGESMTLIKGVDLPNNADKDFSTTAGVATLVDGRITGGDITINNIELVIDDVKVNPQVNLIAENRSVAAAFVNQGSDLIADGLDSLSDQYGYGFKTFAAVYGNRSSYDVNSDLKINGWSEIIGFGRTSRTDMGDFDWGVFYENGVGNYRTYNSFNDEFFRGDGHLLYNGGGIAARLRRDSGLYYEGSLRAGTLKSEMDNAVKDGAGSFYGYESDSAYWGAHLGIGKIFDIDNDKELDVYGRYFHTDVDGDSFDIGGDRFEFDSVKSDRLRIGAQLTANKNNKWSAVYGLAYEYEFNGGSDMRAAQFDLPEQSLKGGTVIGKIGFNYKDEANSPWSIDLNLTGYQGQRDGFSGSAWATYNF